MRTAIAVAAAIAATSVSFAVATAANQQPAAQTSATDRAVVRQLQTLNRNIRDIENSLGSSAFIGGGLRQEVRSYFDDTEDGLRTICNAVRASSDSFVSCL